MILRVIPNLLSLLRIGLAGAFPFVGPPWRIGFVVTAGLTDWLDGFIARRFDARTALGQLLDAVADKLFVLSVLLTVTLAGALAWWQMPLVIARDLIVVLVTAYVLLKRGWPALRRLKPRMPGKVTTAAQFALFATLLIWPGTRFAAAVLALTIACSGAAALDYLWLFVRELRE